MYREDKLLSASVATQASTNDWTEASSEETVWANEATWPVKDGAPAGTRSSPSTTAAYADLRQGYNTPSEPQSCRVILQRQKCTLA